MALGFCAVMFFWLGLCVCWMNSCVVGGCWSYRWAKVTWWTNQMFGSEADGVDTRKQIEIEIVLHFVLLVCTNIDLELQWLTCWHWTPSTFTFFQTSVSPPLLLLFCRPQHCISLWRHIPIRFSNMLETFNTKCTTNTLCVCVLLLPSRYGNKPLIYLEINHKGR